MLMETGTKVLYLVMSGLFGFCLSDLILIPVMPALINPWIDALVIVVDILLLILLYRDLHKSDKSRTTIYTEFKELKK
jgi:hypothetical protein